MAQAAEEYGSHDKTFEIAATAPSRVVDEAGDVLLEHEVERRATSGAPARPRTSPIRDWVKLAVTRARATGAPAVFWLDETRGARRRPDRQGQAVPAPTTTPRASTIRDPGAGRGDAVLAASASAAARTPSRSPATCCATTSTDLFPILELGTSAKMLSIVPLMTGGGLLRDRRRRLGARSTCSSWSRRTTCAGTRLGEFLALARPLRAPAPTPPATRRRRCSADTLDRGDGHASSRRTSRRRGASARSTTAAATSTWPCTGRRSWRPQTDDAELAAARSPRSPRRLAAERGDDRRRAGRRAGLAGRHRRLLPRPDADKASAAMRPSATFNAALATLGSGPDQGSAPRQNSLPSGSA